MGRRRTAGRTGGLQQGAVAAGTGRVLDAAGAANRPGGQGVTAASFDVEWRAIAKSLATRPAGEIKRVMRASPRRRPSRPLRGVGGRRTLAAADKVMKRGSNPRRSVSRLQTDRDSRANCRSHRSFGNALAPISRWGRCRPNSPRRPNELRAGHLPIRQFGDLDDVARSSRLDVRESHAEAFTADTRRASGRPRLLSWWRRNPCPIANW